MAHLPWDQPSYGKKKTKKRKAKKKAKKKARKAKKKAAPRKRAKKSAPKRKARKAKKHAFRRTCDCRVCAAYEKRLKAKKTPRKKAKKKAKKAASRKRGKARQRLTPRNSGSKTWTLTHLPTGLAAVPCVKGKNKLKQLAVYLTKIRGQRWGNVAEVWKAADKRHKWWEKAHGLVLAAKLGQNPRPKYWIDPGWSGRGEGEDWKRADVLVGTLDGLRVIEGEVLFPDRLWAVHRCVSETELQANPRLQQLVLFPERAPRHGTELFWG